MKNTFLSKQCLELRAGVRKFLDRELTDIKNEINEKKEIPPELIKKMGKHGFFGPLISKVNGGTEAGMIAHCMITEEISKLNVAVSVTRTPCILDGFLMEKFASDAQKKKYLKKIATAEKICSICITEQEAGSNVAEIKTMARKSGDEYILNGSKRFITNAGIADYYFIWAITDPSVNPRRGMSVFLVEKDSPGFTVDNPYGLLGLNGVHNGTLALENVAVPSENRVGEENKGFQMLMETFNVERLTLSSECNGISMAALADSKKYAKTRLQFGKPIASFQVIRHKIAEMATKVRAARLLTYSAGKMFEQELNFTKEASMAKAFSSKSAVEVALDAIQIHGGDGYTDIYPVERYLRDAKFFQIGGGTSEIQNLIIAREELK
ncbi:MAG: acyl-CoA dehydrogenase family protein [Candidatus Helarchaeota archaeon]